MYLHTYCIHTKVACFLRTCSPKRQTLKSKQIKIFALKENERKPFSWKMLSTNDLLKRS